MEKRFRGRVFPVAVALSLFLIHTFPAAAKKETAPQKKISPVWDSYSYPEIPDYMKHWEFGIDIGAEAAPHYFADLILPLYATDAQDRALLFEPRTSYAQGESLFNTGLVYRHLVRDRTWLLGGNLFHDYDARYSHYRLGLGVEALSAVAEARLNGYLGLSRARSVETSASVDNYEEAVDGLDVEVGAPIPFYHRLKLFGQYEWYNFKRFKNREGWAVRAEYRPIPAIVMDVSLSDHTKRNIGWGMTVAFRPPFRGNVPERIPSPFKLDKTFFPEGDVGDRLYIPVERHHEIVVERASVDNGGIDIEIRRGT